MKSFSTFFEFQSLLISHLPTKYRHKLLACIGLIIASSASEVASIAFLGRFASYMVDSQPVVNERATLGVIDRVISSLIDPTVGSYSALATVILVFTIALFLRNLNAHYISLTCADITAFANTAILSQNIYSATYSTSRKSSSSVLADLTSYASIFQEQIMQPLLLATSALIQVISFLALMFASSSLISCMLIFPPLVSYMSASLILRGKIRLNSQAFENHSAHSLALATDAIGGYKDIFLNNLFVPVLAEYKKEDKSARYANGRLFVYATNPRFFAETSAYIAIIGLPLATHILNKSLDIGAFATCLLSMQKLLPASQQIYFNISRLRSVDMYISRLIVAIHAQYNLLTQAELLDCNHSKHASDYTKSSKLRFQSLTLERVSFWYNLDYSEMTVSKPPPPSVKVLSNISFRINSGDTLFIGGPSGSGKTTMMNLMIGLIKPTHGRVLLSALDESSMASVYVSDVASYAPRLFSYCQQNPHIYNETVVYNVTLSKSLQKICLDDYYTCLRVCMLDELINSLPEGHSTRIGQSGHKLSGGQYQRIALARALYAKKDVIFLDECTSALDTDTARSIVSSILNEYKQTTFIMISHDKSLSDLFSKQLNL